MNQMHGAAWAAALERYEGGYAEAFDATDPQAVRSLLQLLEEELWVRIAANIASHVNEAAERIRGLQIHNDPQTAALEESACQL